jgi:hypothetical protein
MTSMGLKRDVWFAVTTSSVSSSHRVVFSGTDTETETGTGLWRHDEQHLVR